MLRHGLPSLRGLPRQSVAVVSRIDAAGKKRALRNNHLPLSVSFSEDIVVRVTVFNRLASDPLHNVYVRDNDCGIAFDLDLYIAEFDDEFLLVDHIAAHDARLVGESVIFGPDQVVREYLRKPRGIPLDRSIAKLILEAHNLSLIGGFRLVVLYALPPELGRREQDRTQKKRIFHLRHSNRDA